MMSSSRSWRPRRLTLKSGNPTDPSVIIGPLINDQALRQCEERVRDAVDRGARVVTGGRAHGRIFAPTILTHVPKDAICSLGTEETFGPILVIEAVDDAEEALRAPRRFPMA